MPAVLLVLSAADRWILADGTKHPTGVWAEELVEPYRVFAEAGWDVAIATPAGVPPKIDRLSLRGTPGRVRARKAALAALQERLARPLSLSDVDPDAYHVVFYPGGHGPMEDLAVDAVSGALLARRMDRGEPVAFLCHAPAAAFAARRPDGSWPFAGYRMTALSNREERFNRFARGAAWLLETRLREEGARYDRSRVPFRPHLVVDRNLFTGQNPASSTLLAQRVVLDLGHPLLSASVSRLIEADAHALHALVRDVTSVGGRSPETTRATWIEPDRTFRGWNHIGPAYRWSTVSTVTEDEPGRVFAWHTGAPSHTDWRFEFTPQRGGTLVTESFTHQRTQPAPIRAMQRLAGVQHRVPHLRAGMERTLEGLAAQATRR